VLEALPSGLHKGRVVSWLRGRVTAGGAWFLALGDDLTDERMFEALGERDVAVRVGDEDRASAARWRLEGPGEVRDLLERLAREEEEMHS
jgi:trehalose-phosphatase